MKQDQWIGSSNSAIRDQDFIILFCEAVELRKIMEKKIWKIMEWWKNCGKKYQGGMGYRTQTKKEKKDLLTICSGHHFAVMKHFHE